MDRRAREETQWVKIMFPGKNFRNYWNYVDSITALQNDVDSHNEPEVWKNLPVCHSKDYVVII